MAVMFAIEGLYSNFEQRATNDSHSKEAAETRQAFILAAQQERETLRSWRWLPRLRCVRPPVTGS